MVDDSFQGDSAARSFTEDGKATDINVAISLEPEEKKETPEKRAIPCEVDDIVVQSLSEQHVDEDDLSAHDFLCFAWQISQGMVRKLHNVHHSSR